MREARPHFHEHLLRDAVQGLLRRSRKGGRRRFALPRRAVVSLQARQQTALFVPRASEHQDMELAMIMEQAMRFRCRRYQAPQHGPEP